MWLENLYIVGQDNEGPQCVEIQGEKIENIQERCQLDEAEKIDFQGALIFPGLINAHDHLALNLFPQIARKPYKNYIEWAKDVQTNHQKVIQSVLAVPKPISYAWGLLKNCVAGVSTVVQHGPVFPNHLAQLIAVHTATIPLHSIAFEKYWPLKVLRKRSFPIAIHLGEGTNPEMEFEYKKLMQWNWQKNEIIAIHGIGLTADQVKGLKSLVWCPDSNFLLYQQTARVDQFIRNIPILFGTDSTLSADWNIWKHLRLARSTHLLSDEVLFQSCTATAAHVLNLKAQGQVKSSFKADLVVAKKHAKSIWNAFYQLNPEDILLILKAGKKVLLDDSKKVHMDQNLTYFPIQLGATKKWIAYDFPKLKHQIEHYYPEHSLPVL